MHYLYSFTVLKTSEKPFEYRKMSMVLHLDFPVLLWEVYNNYFYKNLNNNC